MTNDPYRSSPVPPPLPIKPLQYGTPLPAGSSFVGRPNRGQQLAKASWVAPGVAFFLNILSKAAVGGSRGSGTTDLQSARMIAVAIGVINLGLILFGLVAGIIALFSMGKYGRQGVLGPAIAGVCINGLILAAAVFAIFALSRM